MDDRSCPPAGHEPEPAWRRLESRLVHATPWFDVRKDVVVRPDGGTGVYDHVVAPGSVTVLALDDADHVLLVHQWIYTQGARQWRLVSGGVDRRDRDPAAAARRELAEEAGLAAREWTPLGRIQEADSLTNQVDHVFLATGLSAEPVDPGPGESDLRSRRVPFDEALGMLMDGQVPHAGSAYALLVVSADRVRRRERG